MSWFTLASRESEHGPCPRCGQPLSNEVPSLDHHLFECMHCSARIFRWSFDRQDLRISVDDAPTTVKQFLFWANEALDELEFVELVVAFEEMFESYIP